MFEGVVALLIYMVQLWFICTSRGCKYE